MYIYRLNPINKISLFLHLNKNSTRIEHSGKKKIYWTGYVFDAGKPLGEEECGQEVENYSYMRCKR
jgi:hypothetical protein